MDSRGWLRFGGTALLIYGGLFVYLCVQHVTYAGFLELMEADTLHQIARIADGKPAYPLPDGEFIALAEEIGLIGSIGAWVLKQACAEAIKWPDHMRIAVNLSPAQFKSRTLVLDVAAALASGLFQ